MLLLFEHDTLFLLSEPKKQLLKPKCTFKYPLYNESANTVFLLYYKSVHKNWLPPAHQEQFEKMITRGFKYTLDKVAAYNIQEIIQNPDIELIVQPEVIFYMDAKIPDVVQKWLEVQKTEIYYLPSLAQMTIADKTENKKFKQEAWNIIQEYLTKLG